MLRIGCHLKLARNYGPQPRLSHEPDHTVPAAIEPLRLQITQNPWAAIGLVALLKRPTDADKKNFVFLVTGTRFLGFAISPSIKAATCDLHEAAEQRNRKLPVMLLNELVSHAGRLVKIPMPLKVAAPPFLESHSPL